MSDNWKRQIGIINNDDDDDDDDDDEKVNADTDTKLATVVVCCLFEKLVHFFHLF